MDRVELKAVRKSQKQIVDPSSFEVVCDWISGWVLCAMLAFSPWAFGTTQSWSIRLMNGAGFFLGALLVAKIISRIFCNAKHRSQSAGQKKNSRRSIFVAALFALTILILAYCAISAWNARATYSYAVSSFEYHEFISWLPHSYDSVRSWSLFWNYFALACAFWATRDWLQNEPSKFSYDEENPLFSRRWKKLLWIICVNGGLLGLEGLIQRADNSGKLLWLVAPRIHKDAVSQFGPFAYRSNGAQYLNLIWPLAVGLWWSLQRSVARAAREQFRSRSFDKKSPQTLHYLLLPAAMIMAAGAIISLSRGGLLVAVGQIVLCFFVLIATARRSSWKVQGSIVALCTVTVALAGYVNWTQLKQRFSTVATDNLSGRVRLYEIAAQMIRDYPVFGTGPNTFDPVSQLYLESPDATWTVQVHNDWLETLATFGGVGSALIWLALLLVLARPFFKFHEIRGRTPLVIFIWIALGGCLVHGAFDFPFQIYSILFLFLVLLALLSSISIRKRS